MYEQIIPKIYSSNKRLQFSQTICFFPQDGITLKLPTTGTTEPGEIIFQFCIVDNVNEKGSSFTIESSDANTLKISLINFGSTFGSGTTSPIEISIGNKSYSILLYAHRLQNETNPDEQLLHMTISMFGAE